MLAVLVGAASEDDMPKTPADLDPAPERLAAVLRERIYGGITCLSTLLILVRHVGPDSAPSTAAVDVAVDGGALWAASLFADYVSHMVAHGRGPRGSEIAHGLRASGQILEAFAVPLLPSCWRAWASSRSVPRCGPVSGSRSARWGCLRCSPPAASPCRTGSGRCSLWYCWRWARSW